MIPSVAFQPRHRKDSTPPRFARICTSSEEARIPRGGLHARATRRLPASARRRGLTPLCIRIPARSLFSSLLRICSHPISALTAPPSLDRAYHSLQEHRKTFARAQCHALRCWSFLCHGFPILFGSLCLCWERLFACACVCVCYTPAQRSPCSSGATLLQTTFFSLNQQRQKSTHLAHAARRTQRKSRGSWASR